MNGSIGGYFELELKQGEHYHKDAIQLNTARNCLEYILKAKKYKKIYIPYYTCDVLFEPIKKCEVTYEFYHINFDLEPEKQFLLKEEEVFLYINYFGLKQNEATRLSEIYSKQLIIDNSQAFYSEPIKDVDTFYSPRKFFGVSDGAYLFTDGYLYEDFEQDVSYKRMLHLLKRIDIGEEEGYSDFKQNNILLANQPIRKMSNLTNKILKSIDYQSINERRRKNFIFLNNQLNDNNLLKFTFSEENVPMVYPFLSERHNIKQKLIEEKIFIATYWPNVIKWCNEDHLEYRLTKDVIYIPIDQRYNIDDMNHILTVLQRLLLK